MDCNTNCGVYKITNLVNGKLYIGSSVDLKTRRRSHLRELENNIHSNGRMQNSFNKYGRNNFKFEVVEIVEDKNVLRDKEQHWIDKTDACNRNIGFNINRLATGGGNFGKDNSNFGNKGIKNPLSKQIAQIDADTLKVIKVWGASIDITRELNFHGGNICQVCIHLERHSEKKKYKGYYWCYEKDIEKFLSSVDYVDPQLKRVIQIDKDTGEQLNVFDSVSIAAKFIGVGLENISRVCKGKNKTCAGYVWKYENDNYNGISYKPRKKIISKNNPRARKVVQLSVYGEYINTYNTVKEAAEINNVSSSGIYVTLSRGSGHASGGYRWMYLEKYNELSDIEKSIMIEELSMNIYKPYASIGSKNKLSKKVVQLTKGNELIDTYSSMSEAQSKTNISSSYISACCLGKRKTTGGYKWMYLEEYEKLKSAN